MGLYLCIFDGDEDVDGVDVGAYGDWGTFIKAVVDHVENGQRGSRWPVLTLHSDCDGKWSPTECVELGSALDEIQRVFQKTPPVPPLEGWKLKVAKQMALQFTDLSKCFFDVDGESLIERLRGLAKLAEKLDRPILFQ